MTICSNMSVFWVSLLQTLVLLMFVEVKGYEEMSSITRSLRDENNRGGPRTSSSTASAKMHASRTGQSRVRNSHQTFEKATQNSAHKPHVVRMPMPSSNISWKSFHLHQQKIVAFYNFYLDENNMYVNICHEQLDIMKTTGLFSRLDSFYYVTIGKDYRKIDKTIQNKLNTTDPIFNQHQQQIGFPIEAKISRTTSFIHLYNSITPIDETLTLSYLYDFCHHNPDSIVLYFHDKGSYHPSADNLYFRNFLDCYVLNTHCVDALLNEKDKLDTCGFRFSPFPSTHYSGNFWWARCSYVNTLIHPGSRTLNQTFVKGQNTYGNGIVSFDRYLAESWIGSGPRIKPADCLDHEVDQGQYLCGYGFHPISIHQCPNHRGHFPRDGTQKNEQYSQRMRERLHSNASLILGSTCKLAEIIRNPSHYAAVYERMRGKQEFGFQNDLVSEMIKRSYWWYGEEPHSYLEMTKSLVWFNRSILPKRSVILMEPFFHFHCLYENDQIVINRHKVMAAFKNKSIPRITMSKFKIDHLRLSNVDNFNATNN